MPRPLRVALIGPGKIGAHHAKWYAAAGCELVGFATSSPDTLATRATQLAAVAGQAGRGFTDVAAMLDTLAPDLVSVCSPPALHLSHARLALARGVATLCEKPLGWGADLDAVVAEAEALCDLADARGVLFGVNLQYALAAEAYRALVGDTGAVREVAVVLESRGSGAERTPEQVWTELGPHALSLVLTLAPGATPLLATLQCRTAPRTALVEFQLAGPDGPVRAVVETGQRLDGPLVRRFGVNGRLADYAGRNNAAGRYATFLSQGGICRESVDLMEQSLTRFVAARKTGVQEAPIPARMAATNLRLQAALAVELARQV